MTVAEAISLLPDAKQIAIAWGAFSRNIHPDDELDMDAYGQYLVHRISYHGNDKFELSLVMRPAKAE